MKIWYWHWTRHHSDLMSHLQNICVDSVSTHAHPTDLVSQQPWTPLPIVPLHFLGQGHHRCPSLPLFLSSLCDALLCSHLIAKPFSYLFWFSGFDLGASVYQTCSWLPSDIPICQSLTLYCVHNEFGLHVGFVCLIPSKNILAFTSSSLSAFVTPQT